MSMVEVEIRSGIEATISWMNRLTGLKRSWTRGKDRLRIPVIFKALAVNINRFIHYTLEKARKARRGEPGLLAPDNWASSLMPFGLKKDFSDSFCSVWAA